ncbi:MAG: AI-2E family transporter [Candidatus Paceibacterota bacterium]|jgi:predicted PurR-regulated permease PerM
MTQIDISWQTIFKIVFVSLLFYAIFILKGVLGWIFIALIISILVNPIIDFLKINRVLSSTLVYFLILLIFGFFIYLIVPPLVLEIQSFSGVFGNYFNELPAFLSNIGLDSFDKFYDLGTKFNETLIKISSNLFNVFASLFGSIFAGITIFTLALFFSIEKDDILKGIRTITPKRFEQQVLDRWEKSQKHVVGWFGSRIISSIFIGVMTFVLCVFLDIKFALMWGLLSGVLNIVPMIGPVVAALVVGLFVLIESLPKAILITVFAIIIQQIESNLLMPILSKKINGLPVSLVLISILIGGVVWGVMGAVLSIPVAGIIFESFKDYFKSKKE